MPASSSLSIPSKAEYLSKRYGNSHEDSDRKEKKKKRRKEDKKKKKKSKTNDERGSSDDEDSLLGGSHAYRRDDNSGAESDEDRPLVVEENDHFDDAGNGGNKDKGRRRPYDSDDAAAAAPSRAPARVQKRRYDSDDDADNGSGSPSPPRSSEVAASGRARNNRQRRYDSDDADESDDGKHKHRAGATKPEGDRKRRYDSDDDDDNDKDSGSDAGSAGARRRTTTASGHRAGLQSGRTFGTAEKRIFQSKHDEAQKTVDTHGIGETVYRDKASGRREAAVSATAPDRPASILTPEEQAALLNVGRVQREAVEERHRRMEDMAASSFARHQDDDGLEEMRKSAIREGDPMAAYASSKGTESKRNKNGGGAARTEPQNARPVYKGPPPKPNRYGIRPGFRWDGVDRGNGFEDRLLARRYNQQHQKELAYRMSSADM